MNEQEIRNKLINILKDFGVNDLNGNITKDLDSLDLLDLSFEIDKVFNKEIKIIPETLDELVKLLQ
jgi:acyl carrier protein